MHGYVESYKEAFMRTSMCLYFSYFYSVFNKMMQKEKIEKIRNFVWKPLKINVL